MENHPKLREEEKLRIDILKRFEPAPKNGRHVVLKNA
jgi:hypothetical protein